MKHVIVLITDERSMISSELIAASERNIKENIFGGVCEKKCFGGVPVVLLFGDDSQLPPVSIHGRGDGAFHVFDKYIKRKKNSNIMINKSNGKELFKLMAKNVMQLSERKQQHGDDFMVDILDDLETGKPSDMTISTIMNLQLNNLPLHIRQDIESKSTYIFATHIDKNDHNYCKLANLSNKHNPLTCLKYQDVTVCPKGCNKRNFDHDSTPISTHFCVGAKVCMKGKNIQPKWGLFNGTMGTIQEIGYEKGCNPNYGDLPAYVAVVFLLYKPPKMVPNFYYKNPQV